MNGEPTTRQVKEIGQETELNVDLHREIQGGSSTWDLVGKARDSLACSLQRVAEGLDEWAETLRAQSGDSESVSAEAGAKVAQKMAETAGSLRHFQKGRLSSSGKQMVKRSLLVLPGAFLGGLVVGVLAVRRE